MSQRVNNACTDSVASLRLVSPAAATDGLTLFSPEKNHRPLKSDDPF